MRKGQGSLEYLLILAAILAIAVVVVVVAQSMLNPATKSAEVTEDKFNCATAGIELVDYKEAYDGGTVNFDVQYSGDDYTSCALVTDETKTVTSPDATCDIGGGDYTLKVEKTSTPTYLCDVVSNLP